MRADRLLSILMLLQSKGRLTAYELAERLEVSERTIYRDLEALGIAGIPVYAERGPGGGCSLVDGYQTRLTGLTEAEVRALFLYTLAGPLADLGMSKALDDALLKLSAALPATFRNDAEQARQRVHLDTTWWYHSNKSTPCLQTLQDAVWHDRSVCLFYQEDDGAYREYLVDAYGLVAKASVWYLVGAVQGEKRIFRVSRVQAVEVTEAQFVRSGDFDLASYWTDYCIQLEARLPHYALPLHLAPDEVEMLPQTLSKWGYRLVESEELMETNERIVAFRSAQEKKEISHMGHAPLVGSNAPREKTFFVLTGTGQWKAVGWQRRQKKQFNRLESNPASLQKKAPSQAKGEGFQKKRSPVQQKKASGPTKKRGNAQTKKSLYMVNKKKPLEAAKKTASHSIIKKPHSTLLTSTLLLLVA